MANPSVAPAVKREAEEDSGRAFCGDERYVFDKPKPALTYPRGTAFHEAGHAIIGWSFGLEVRAVRVSVDDASGGTDIGPHGHLSLVEQLALWLAGNEAEGLFEAPAHRWVFGSDFDEIQELLAAHGIANGEGPALRERGRAIARERLEMHRAKVIALAERLMHCGSVEAPEFG